MIRNATKDDLPYILEIYNDAIINTTAIYDYNKHSLEDREKWYADKKSSNLPIIVFEDKNIVAGFATFGSFRPYPAFKYCIEHSLYVHKAFRNRGIATSLMKELIKLATEKGYKTMVAGIDSLNTSSISLHKKLGFTYSGRINNAGYKFDKWLHLDFYQLNLN